jgi:hypothetical protein
MRMLKKIVIVLLASTAILLNGCSKKSVPTKTATVIPRKGTAVNTNMRKIETASEPSKPETVVAAPAVEEKSAPKPAAKPEFPKVITVNDNAANKSIDGRLFYDVLGHRYWKNYSDGKYYLFDKSMYKNSDFKPPK